MGVEFAVLTVLPDEAAKRLGCPAREGRSGESSSCQVSPRMSVASGTKLAANRSQLIDSPQSQP